MILTEAPAGARVLDFAPARAARAEARAARGEPAAFIKLAVGYVGVRAEIPLEAAILLEESKLREGLAGILTDPSDIDALLADGLATNDLEALVELITGGVKLGE